MRQHRDSSLLARYQAAAKNAPSHYALDAPPRFDITAYSRHYQRHAFSSQQTYDGRRKMMIVAIILKVSHLIAAAHAMPSLMKRTFIYLLQHMSQEGDAFTRAAAVERPAASPARIDILPHDASPRILL